MTQAATPFMLFWLALNLHRAELGRPELMYGDARTLWGDTIRTMRTF